MCLAGQAISHGSLHRSKPAGRSGRRRGTNDADEPFDSDADALNVIKLKDLYELLESATDRCEDVADVIQNIAVKHL